MGVGALGAGRPDARLPLDLPVALIHGRDDETVPVTHSREYAATATAAGLTTQRE